MSAALYLGVRLPEKPYERLKFNDINFSTKKVIDLKVDAEKLLNYSSQQMEFIYCGIVLENDSKSLAEQGVLEGATIHVFAKPEEDIVPDTQPITEEEIQLAVVNYRLIVKELTGTALAKALRPEVVKRVLHAYPEFYNNLGALAILKDAILLSRLSYLDTAKDMAKQYPVLIRSADFVIKALRDHVAEAAKEISPIVPSEDSMSDSSSSEGDAPTASSSNQGGDIRQISRDQLSAALLMAGTSSLNSLSNIAQRNTGTSVNAVAPSGSQVLSPIPSTSSSSSNNANTPSASGGSILESTMISNSLLSNALSQALLSTPARADGTVTRPEAMVESPSGGAAGAAVVASENDNLLARYQNELATMREMGLYDEHINVQALAVSNGDVEAAINLVLSGFGPL